MRASGLLTKAMMVSVLLGGSPGAAERPASPSGGRSKPSVVTAAEAQNGSTLTLAPGARLLVTLPANGTTGYAWTVSQLPKHLRFLGSDYSAAPQPANGPPVAGGEGRQSLSFQLKSAGAGTLQLTYRQSWQGGSKAQVYRLRIVSPRRRP